MREECRDARGTRRIEDALHGLTPTDPVTLSGACIVLVVVSAAAFYLPARQAARIDPLTALRDE